MDNFSPDFIIKCECFEDLMEERMGWIDGLEGVGEFGMSPIIFIKTQ
ncbi:hypothetical protein [Clostridium beijerinckii]|uniref:Uncharacterized protein n=1 Tax=Clostridium beijerinckii TaxID=1520 RepID=A0A9Q5GNH8_CLOBE|nr:hypothetical protein [Clostridium beijerinckii]MBA2887307.1 hypothetical protein [Clostridium beijerinckii]MBA2902093.1 hypothetical protein [Clostridium beijerinckii]MBA2912020.1 hypothetical protein [Clostridium beijerinckii]MBA9017989.1 hypothetical protein [Clostridium beijerinckii]MBC2418178.1 hypothetical protein [Clostridium beijerinckii]